MFWFMSIIYTYAHIQYFLLFNVLFCLLDYAPGAWWFKVICSWNWDWRAATSRCCWCKPASTTNLIWSKFNLFTWIVPLFEMLLTFWRFMCLSIFGFSLIVLSWSLQLKDLMVQLLAKQRLSHGDVQAFGTPRRLVVRLEILSPYALAIYWFYFSTQAFSCWGRTFYILLGAST